MYHRKYISGLPVPWLIDTEVSGNQCTGWPEYCMNYVKSCGRFQRLGLSIEMIVSEIKPINHLNEPGVSFDFFPCFPVCSSTTDSIRFFLHWKGDVDQLTCSILPPRTLQRAEKRVSHTKILVIYFLSDKNLRRVWKMARNAYGYKHGIWWPTFRPCNQVSKSFVVCTLFWSGGALDRYDFWARSSGVETGLLIHYFSLTIEHCSFCLHEIWGRDRTNCQGGNGWRDMTLHMTFRDGLEHQLPTSTFLRRLALHEINSVVMKYGFVVVFVVSAYKLEICIEILPVWSLRIVTFKIH